MRTALTACRPRDERYLPVQRAANYQLPGTFQLKMEIAELGLAPLSVAPSFGEDTVLEVTRAALKCVHCLDDCGARPQ
jgi:hypothetical protein